MTLSNLSTAALLDGIHTLLGSERQTLSRLIAHLIEVEDRRAHLAEACSSLFDFCVRKLGLSEGEAFRRINAARLGRRFPIVLRMIENGSIHLSALVLLRDHLTDADHEVLLREASGRSKRQIEELIAARRPRPDVVPTIRKLPHPSPRPVREVLVGLRHDAGLVSSSGASIGASIDTRAETSSPRAPMPVVSASRPASVAPLSARRYKVQLTAGHELTQKLERAARLMGRHAERDLPEVIERALDLLVADLEKRRLGKTARPRRRRAAKAGHVTRAVRREVVARDGEQCAYVNQAGERCPSREHLELDHAHPRARGGAGSTSNVRWLCRAHNQWAAERAFGRRYVAERIRLRREKQSLAKVCAASDNGAPGSAPEHAAPDPSGLSRPSPRSAVRNSDTGYRLPIG